jgi:hypothetical protein
MSHRPEPSSDFWFEYLCERLSRRLAGISTASRLTVATWLHIPTMNLISVSHLSVQDTRSVPGLKASRSRLAVHCHATGVHYDAPPQLPAAYQVKVTGIHDSVVCTVDMQVLTHM